MFLDDLLKMKMTREMMDDFINFGFTAETDFIEGVFHGRIHRFAIFCDITGEVSYKTIKVHDFRNNLSGFKKLYGKIEKDEQYKNYEATSQGEPVLDEEMITEIRYRI